MKPLFASFLLIDDDPDDHEIFVSVLKMVSAHATCVSFTDAALALHEITTGHLKFDVIFIDLNMPKIDGLQFLVLIRDFLTHSSIPVYVYSTSSDPQIIRKALSLGASHFVTKAASIEGLKELLSGITVQ